jgi:5'-nucleotidase
MKNRKTAFDFRLHSVVRSPLARVVTSAVLALFLGSCASFQKDEESPLFENTGKLETVVILGTNDIHGALAPEKLKTRDPSPIEYEKGGAVYFATQLRLLRNQYGGHLLFLDAGDQFQGSIDSNLEEGRPMVKFFNELGLTAAAIGNHEFDFGPSGSQGSYDPKTATGQDLRSTLKERISEARYPYLAANVVDKRTGEFPGIPGTKKSIIVSAGRLRVGIIGLTTVDTPTSSRPEFSKGLEFKDLAKTTLEEAKRLRSDGAHIVVVVSHAGVVCDIPVAPDRAGKTGLVKSEADFQTGCESNHEIPQLLRALPKGTVDAVVSGHLHTLVHHWIEGVPVIQAGTRNNYFNLAYLTYDWSQNRLVPEKTRIEGPIPICPKIFKNQKNCNGDARAPPEGRGKLVDARFRKSEIVPDSAMEAILRPTFERTEAKKQEVVAQARRPIPHLKTEESPLGNVVADALRESLRTDIGLMNVGGIRSDWEAGPIRYVDVFRALPFDNYLAKVVLSGKELRRLVRITHAGSRGFYSTSGLRVRVVRREEEPFSSDLDGDRKISPWELDRLINVTLADGTPIEDSKMYSVATIDFLLSGGDSLGWFFSQVAKDRQTPIAGPVLRESVIDYIRARSTREGGLNGDNHPVIDSAKPRLELASRPAKASSGKRQSSGARKKRRR